MKGNIIMGKIKKAAGITFGALVGIVVIAGVTGGGESSTSAASTPGATSASSAAPAVEVEVSGPVAAGQVVNLDGLEVSATPVKRVKASFGSGAYLCTDVSYVNNSGDTVTANAMDWKLQDKDGAAQNMTIGAAGAVDLFTSSEIASPGKAKGTVCFDDKGAGSYVIQFDSMLEFGLDTADFTTSR